MKKLHVILFFFSLMIISCNTLNENISEVDEIVEEEIIVNDSIPTETNIFKILALGDSYTIGQSVCETCRFPAQLKDSILLNFDKNTDITLKIIARTGWTTTNLINAIANDSLSSDFELVTLLIGVNNQFQNKDFSIYETEFPALLNTAIEAANNDKSNVIVVSIPDYAFTPFGRGNTKISQEIDAYNTFAENYCALNEISFVNITEITRQGLRNTNLVASDGLHPSELAYTKFVEKILPLALQKLND